MPPIAKLHPRAVVRLCRNALMDLRFGGFAGGYRRNPVHGAHGTGATDYALMPQIFHDPIAPSDVLVDVGCGQGRVLNYWLSRGLRNRIYGLEMMEDVAEKTRSRLIRYPNVTIIAGDALEHLPLDGTLYYLANPFDETFMTPFRDKLERVREIHPFRVIYYAPTCIEVFRGQGWEFEMHPLRMPEAGAFDERHKWIAYIRPAQANKNDTRLSEDDRQASAS